MKVLVKQDTPAFILLMNSIGEEREIIDAMKPLELNENGDFVFYLELKMNGQELNFNNFIESINKGYSKAVNKGIKEYMANKLFEIDKSLEDLQSRVEDLVATQPYSWEENYYKDENY